MRGPDGTDRVKRRARPDLKACVFPTVSLGSLQNYSRSPLQSPGSTITKLLIFICDPKSNTCGTCDQVNTSVMVHGHGQDKAGSGRPRQGSASPLWL